MQMPKAQSAMEYLMTYSWAFLIIAIMIGALYALGFFDTTTYASRAQPGACQVLRPYGPGTVQLVNLQGVCSDNIPKFVAMFSGKNSQITIPSSGYLNFTNQFTISAWVYANSSSSSQDVISRQSSYIFPETTSGWSQVGLNTYIGSLSANYPGLNSWTYVVATYNGISTNIYVNGKLASTSSQSGNVATNNNILIVGAGPASTNWFSGDVSNLQLYNASLSANQITAQYYKGIGGPPTLLQNLAGWWPLNGDFNDYSGNADNGAATNIIFSTSWTKTYSAP
jgi:Concanavalin A-like lectin/glucanases superfamily